jgi:hypothetical protein
MRVAVCTPSHGPAYRRHERCLRALFHAHPDWQPLELPGCPNTDVARNSITESALKWAAEQVDGPCVTLWLDADMTFTVQTCETICREALERNAVVGCLYAAKRFGGKAQCAFFEDQQSFTAFEGGTLIEVEAIGFGCVAVPVRLFEPIASHAKLPPLRVLDRTFRAWFTTEPRDWDQLHSDDYAFCRRARAAGFRIFADARQRVGHIGDHEFHLEDCLPLLRVPSFIAHLKPQTEDAEPPKAAE